MIREESATNDFAGDNPGVEEWRVETMTWGSEQSGARVQASTSIRRVIPCRERWVMGHRIAETLSSMNGGFLVNIIKMGENLFINEEKIIFYIYAHSHHTLLM